MVTRVVVPGTTDATASVAMDWSNDVGFETVNCDPPVNSIENWIGRNSGTRAAPITSTAAMMNHRRRRCTNGKDVFPE